MKEREIAFFRSIQRTLDVGYRKSDDFNALPSFNEDMRRLGQVGSKIAREAQKLELRSLGFTEAKNTAKEELIRQTISLVKRAQAFASVTKDKLLLNEVKVNSSDLRKEPETLLGGTCRRILLVCSGKADLLAPYDVSTGMLTNLDAAITEYETRLSGTPQFRGERKAARQTLQQLFDEADDLLKNSLDVQAEIIRDSHAETYVEYQNARRLETRSGRKISMKGRVLEASTAIPIPGAVVTVVRNPDGEGNETQATTGEKTEKITAARGGFQIPSLLAGSYRVTASKAGYTEQSIRIYVNDHETSLAELTLTKL